jgi:hypothetical protein
MVDEGVIIRIDREHHKIFISGLNLQPYWKRLTEDAERIRHVRSYHIKDIKKYILRDKRQKIEMRCG